MKKLAVLFLSLFFCFSFLRAEEEIFYILKPNFRVGIINLYKMTEVNNVKRLLESGDTLKYNRKIEYYFSLYCPANPIDGFYDLDVSMDSLSYSFSDGTISKSYKTMDQKPAPYSFQDFEMVGPTDGKKFTLTYSPYGEVAKVSGEILEKAIKMLDDKAFGIKDPVRKQIWSNAYSYDHLTYIADVTKNYFPLGKIGRDSVWQNPISLDLNRVYFADTLKARIDKISNEKYILRANLDSLKAISGISMLYDIKDPVQVIESEGKGILDFEFSPAGVINYINGEFSTKVKYKHKTKEIIEFTDTKLNWELLNRLTY